MNKHLISNELQVRVRKRWREELSGEERRALLIEKENKKRREAEEVVAEEISLTTTSSTTTTSTTSLDEKIIKTDKDVCDTISPIPSIPLVPIETKKTTRILHRSATIAVAPIAMYVEENDRTKTTRNAYRVASLKSITTGGSTSNTSTATGIGIGGHSYKETERRQSIRYGPGYIGHTCAMCGAFYSALATSALAATSVGSATAIGAIDARRMCNCASRHRSKFEQDPPTPPDYWDLDDDDWTERIRR